MDGIYVGYVCLHFCGIAAGQVVLERDEHREGVRLGRIRGATEIE
jgi:hypothetical protein